MAEVVLSLVSDTLVGPAGTQPPAGYHPAIFPINNEGMVEKVCANVASCLERNLTLLEKNNLIGPIHIVGGGHSLEGEIENLRNAQGWIFAVNGAHDYLIEQGIVPHALVLADPDEYCLKYVQNPRGDVTYLVASQCHPSVFDALTDSFVRVWHCEGDIPGAIPDGPMRLLGGCSTALRCISIGFVLGIDDFHFWGIDGCYQGAGSHIYEDKDLPEDETTVWFDPKTPAYPDGKIYRTAGHMAMQVDNMVKLLRIFPMLTVHPHGDGLMQDVLRVHGAEVVRPTNSQLRKMAKMEEERVPA